MLKLGAFENSLRGGPDLSASLSATPPKTKQQILQSHHKSCSGEHHGSGIEKWKRNQGVKPHHHHHHRNNSSCSSQSNNRSTSQCSGNSIDLSDTDSGQESLTSPLHANKTLLEGSSCYDSNCCCNSPINKTSQRLYSTPTKASAAKAALDVGKMAGDDDDDIPKIEDDLVNEFVGGRRQSAKDLTLDAVDKSSNRLSMRRKKRTERVSEHVAATPKKNGFAKSQATRKASLNSRNSQESIPEEKNGDDHHARKAVRTQYSRRPSVKDDDGVVKTRKVTPVRSVVNGKGSQESVVDGVRKPSRVVNGTGKPATGQKPSPGPRKSVVSVRRPPPGSRKLSGVNKVSWSELAEISVNSKPNALATTATGRKIALYKDLKLLLKERSGDDQAKSEEQLATEKAWLEAERLWLVHRIGFSGCRRLPEEPSTPGGGDSDTSKIRIRLEATGEILQVDDDDVEKANPPQFDRAEDLAHLRYLSESSVLHTLRQRYGSNLIHTYAGGSLVVINPMAPLAIHSEKVVHMFRGCKSEDMPPHIYSLAQSAYHGMLASRRDHSIVLLGRSGSGKTINFKHVLHYLVLAAGTVNKVVTVEKLNAISTVLEAFGNSRTVLNTNATRFTQIFSLDFDQSGQIASASVQVLLAERSRVSRRPEGEPTFHIFYRLLAGVEGTLRRELHLDSITGETNLFMTPLQKHEDKQKAMLDFARVSAAMEVLGFSDAETKVIWSVLAAIYHLGIAGAVKAGNSSSSRWQFANPQSAQRASHLLGTTVEELARVLFGQSSGGMGTPSTPRAPFRTPSPTDRGLDRDVTGLEALEGMVIGLYGEVLNAVSALINRSISTPIHTVSSLVVVDSPGFQNPASCGQQGGATFEDLCHNYLQERLQLLFHHTALVAPRDRYAQEHIELNLDEGGDGDVCSPGPLISLLDRASQNSMVRTSQTDLREADRRGLLWLLDEEAVYPGASDEGFLERLFTHYGDRDHQLLLRKAPGTNQFILQHLQGTNPVLYTASGWLKASRENPIARNAAVLLQESIREEVSQLFVSVRGPGVASALGGSVVGIEGTQSLRRASSIRRTFTTGTAGIKRKSVCLQVKFTVDGLVETLRRTRLKFVHCFLPHHMAALGETARSGTLKSNSSLTSGCNTSDDLLINIPLVRSQLRGAQILDSVRLHKQGFPKFLPLSEFRRRFRLLAPMEGRPASPVLDERRAVEDMLLGIDIDLASYRVGLSQIFFRSGVLAQLEAQRDERLTDNVVRLQARCRGYLARRKLNKLKIQDLAVRCIQRNVRKFMSVRDWPWWRLLVRVTPLLNVHRTEEELRVKTEELEQLRAKVEKLEQDRTHLKHDNDRLEAKKKGSILSKRNGMPERTDGAVGTLAGILSKAVGLTGKHTAPAPSRDSVMSPTSLSPSRTFSPTRELSPTRSLSPSRVFSPTREIPSTSRAIFSPTRELSTPRLTSPRPDISNRLLSPTRDRAFSPSREYSRLFSPTREHTGSRMLASMREFSSSRMYSPSRDCSSSRVMSPPRYGRSPSLASNGYLHSRSPSPVSYSSRSCSMMSSTDASFPRRIFPQTSARTHYSDELEDKEDAPVVFNAGMSFVMGMKSQSVRQEFKPVASHTESMTASSTLSSKIKDFLRRTDHVMEEWKRLGKKDMDLQNGMDGYTGRSRSATNILIKGFQMYSRNNSSSLRSPSVAHVSEADTISEVDELSEMTADLAEEHSTSTLATERLEAETADRLRLEKELQDVQTENKGLQQATERLEMELLYMRAADVNGGIGSDEDEEGEGDAGVYKQRYERTVRELEFTRRRLQQQHEDDLEQLVGLKKQLEKKLADAFEEVEEQRQVVGQWKRKVQKLNAETNDLRLLLEEQNSRNHLLEKKQRKFDSELQLMQDELRQEKQQKDRISREKELVVAEKYSLEQNLSAVRLELELKEEKVASLARELEELTFGGKTEEEVAHLKKTKHEMDKKLKEQEEELDDLAGQVQLLEQAKLRLEMSLEQQRKENRRELSQRDEELEDVRCSAQKKVKALEAQLESEHEERTQLLREKHELERRLGALEEAGRANRATDEDQLHRLRKDLRRTKALLRDAQTQLERSRGDSPGKAILRQLRNQLEDLEVARAAAVKARQSAEMELAELQAQLDEAQRVKAEAEERAGAAARERSDIRTQLEENEEELAEVLKKYRAAVQQLSVDQMALQEQAGLVAELESERAALKEQLAELSSRLESIETQGDTSSSLAQRRLELRTKELESRLELEQTTRARMEVQISRLKETVEKLQGEAAMARAKEQTAQDAARKLQRSVRELKEEATSGQAREAEVNQRRKDLEKRLESAEAEAAAARGDLRLALTRIQDLQSAIQGELEDCSGSDRSDSEQESDCSDESINTFLSNHKTHSNSTQRVRGASLELDIASRSMESPTKVCSTMKSDSKESFA